MFNVLTCYSCATVMRVKREAWRVLKEQELNVANLV